MEFDSTFVTVDSQLVKRIKSFAWRLAMVVLATVVAYVSENIGLLELPPMVTVVLGLVFGEISKYLNSTGKV